MGRGTVGTLPAAVEGVITITTAEQLAALAVSVNDGNNYSGVTIKLGADIDLSGHNWTPIGTTSSNSFSGTFDGDGKTISNLTVNLPNNYNVGLFGHSKGTIQNVTLTNATVQGKNFVGGLVGSKSGTVSGVYYDVAAATLKKFFPRQMRRGIFYAAAGIRRRRLKHNQISLIDEVQS